MNFLEILAAISAARSIIDNLIIASNAQGGLTDEQKRQIIEAAGRSDAAFDARVAEARARLGR